jgi:hypothetical protein
MHGEHPHALTLSLLIHAEKLSRIGAHGFELGMAEVIERYLTQHGFTDERMADLYGLLAERLKADMMHGEMRVVCSACLFLNEQWANRHG